MLNASAFRAKTPFENKYFYANEITKKHMGLGFRKRAFT